MFLDLYIDRQEQLLGLAVCGLSILAAVFFMFRHLRRYRLIADTPTAMIRSAPQGYVEIIGHVVCGEGGLLHAPLSGRPCVWYRYRIDRQGDEGKGGWKLLERGMSDAWFQINDGTGVCLIDPDKAEIDVAQRSIWHGHSPNPSALVKYATSLGSPSFTTGRYRYTEQLIMEHEQVYALGQFQTVGGGRNTATTSSLQADIIRDWKRNHEQLLAHFAAPGATEFSAIEWQAVREAALEEARQQRQHQLNLPDMHVLTNPGQPGHPLLISTQDEARLIKRFRLRALLCLIYICAALWFCIELLVAQVS
ncbi:GIDE domain-containing protein [Nitrincola sp. A-D6]|uniref:GIDE domain-containing protein n=1 Tax=Nitrincola sp. A-D6 TaxID=1545442 RepID=UPI00068A242F|nr:GIDE domain-containing protein [Nitrincola sp. A-D6]